jgi:CRP-like cAMP-binding protein
LPDQEAVHKYVALEDTLVLMVRTDHSIEISKLYPLVGLNLCRSFADRLQKAGVAGA